MILGSLFLCTRVCFTDFFYVSQCLMEFQVLFTGINQCLFLSVFGFWSVWILLQYLPLIWNKEPALVHLQLENLYTSSYRGFERQNK
ncbi:hypothetical protein Peur_018286 [Populus x canadensis]